MHILFVDDTPNTVEVFRTALRMYGFTVEVAYRGTEAIEIVKQKTQPFDAIVVDVEMPELNGWDTVKAVRELPQGQEPFITLFTAYDNLPDMQTRTSESGADCLLLKPMMPQELSQQIRTGVEERQAKQSRQTYNDS